MDKVISVTAIHIANAALLAVLMVGIPTVTGIDLGALRLSSDTWWERLTIGGLVVGLAMNGLAALWLGRQRQRLVCWGWSLLHTVLLTCAVLAFTGQIHFKWLRTALEFLSRF